MSKLAELFNRQNPQQPTRETESDAQRRVVETGVRTFDLVCAERDHAKTQWNIWYDRANDYEREMNMWKARAETLDRERTFYMRHSAALKGKLEGVLTMISTALSEAVETATGPITSTGPAPSYSETFLSETLIPPRDDTPADGSMDP